ncbi:MAG TPA: GTPase [Pirellulales bacterium]|nr:GTPase [Pirellulales bacterium]
MSVEFQAWADRIKRLHRALNELGAAAKRLGMPTAEESEWFALLERKLLPQLDLKPALVVAVVGGTNIGKSVVFNHLAGENASAVSPLAAGTKHPVCVVPPEFQDERLLSQLFEGFSLRRWQSADDSLTECAEHLVFWRPADSVPPRLLLLDTPDVDSDAAVNWLRADQIRRAADVLIAVLTQQKYNDAAVKQFFRKAAEADKPVIVVFNQCDLADDREFWPRWLETFADETGARPEHVYVVPYDRAAANQRRLPFYEVGPSGTAPIGEPASLRAELSQLHFDAIKVRTFRGALARLLDRETGVPAWLWRLGNAGAEFEAASEALSATEMAGVDWPALPPRLLVEEIRLWWDGRRSGWSRKIHSFYRVVGQGVSWPLREAWRATRGDGERPQETFRARERQAIVEAVEKLLAELERLAQLGNDVLRPRLASLLGGASRESLLVRVAAAHAALPALDDDYRAFLRAELDRWGEGNPAAINVLRSLDHAAALARPAITVTLAVSGWILAGDVVGHAAAHVASQTASHLATEALVAGGTTVGGEAVVSVTGEGVTQAAARLFRRLQLRYAEMRAKWLADWLERELLGGLLAPLREGAELVRSRPFVEVELALDALRSAAPVHADGQ